jgi:hypothetical protein
LNTDNHSHCIEKNVKESKATFIISAGNLNDDAEYARRMTMKYSHQIFTVDLELTPSSEAATLVNDWIQIRVINYSLSIFIRNQLFMKDVNKELFKSCRAVSGNKNLNEATAALVIIEKLWERLQETHRLRIVE